MIPVIDLFAGPGGLGEGFSSILDKDGTPVFQTVMSIEKDPQAHSTLRLRSYVRKILRQDGTLPASYIHHMQVHDEESFESLKSLHPELWEAAGEEALCAELKDGDDTYVELGRQRLSNFGRTENEPWVLIGGPPCQAYSLVGRSRRAHDASLEDDPKQTLYKCYLAFIRELKPTVFVMENVKGLLSAQRKGEHVFKLICDDMHDAGYELYSLVKLNPTCPKDYVVEAERFGVPQMRHRVILLGVQAGKPKPENILSPRETLTLRKALAGIPKIKSGFSDNKNNDKSVPWKKFLNDSIDEMLEYPECEKLQYILERVKSARPPKLMQKNHVTKEPNCYDAWYRGRFGRHTVLANHESRTHLAEDLKRYMFCSAFAECEESPARISDLPRALYPNHKNVQNIEAGAEIKFNDRFRVQLWDRPSTTITSHIAKDGHYYIHPDPEQCRSLTVREAARLQTFPDDYLFEGNRTSQYTQVGNAVPPLLAQQIAKIVSEYLGVPSMGFCDSIPLQSDDDSSLSSGDSQPSEDRPRDS